MKYYFRTNRINDENFKRNGEEVTVIDRHTNRLNITVAFCDGTTTDAYSSEVLELSEIKDLSYTNMENEDTDVGFEYKDAWITNPFLEETARTEFASFDKMCDYYGKENVSAFIRLLILNTLD